MRWIGVAVLGGCSFQPSPVTIDAAHADAARRDARPDASAPVPALLAFFDSNAANTAALTYAADVPSGDGLLLLVSVQLGGSCGSVAPPTTSVLYGGIGLSEVTMIAGVPCSMQSTRTELWQLLNPTVGDSDVVITIAGSTESISSSALVFAGTNATQPVAASVAMEGGSDTEASATVPSEPGQLVVSFIGQGSGIGAPEGSAHEVFVENVNDLDTLDNIAASTLPATASATAMGWTFTGNDYWETVVTALQP